MMDGTPRAAWVNEPSDEFKARNPQWDKPDTASQAAKGKEKDNEQPQKPMIVVDPRSLQDKLVPERRWIVRDWLPFGYTTALYGDGGTGKTLLAQQLMTSCATGVPWLGMTTMRCPVLGLFCEDDEDELHRRQHAIKY